jgi:hypothetical protein
VEWINDHCKALTVSSMFQDIDDLAAHGLPEKMVAILRALATGGEDERAVVIAFLDILPGSRLGRRFTNAARESIAQAIIETNPSPALREAVRRHIGIGMMGGWRVK